MSEKAGEGVIYSNRMIQTVSSHYEKNYRHFPHPEEDWMFKDIDIDRSTLLLCSGRGWINRSTEKAPYEWNTGQELWSAIQSTREKRENSND